MIEGALERAAGNISETARMLGLTRRGLYLKMERLGVSESAECSSLALSFPAAVGPTVGTGVFIRTKLIVYAT